MATKTQDSGDDQRKQHIQSLNKFYEGTTLIGDFARFEPAWKLGPFDALDGLDGEDLADLAEQIGTTDLSNVCPLFGPRPLQDGFKISTSSWVFLGRREAERVGLIKVSLAKPNLIASARKVPMGCGMLSGKTLWCLWKTNDNGHTIYDRNAGSESDVNQILANPDDYGL